MVGNASAYFEARLGGADVHETEDLHRIRVDDLRVAARRKLERESSFAARGGAGQDDDRMFWAVTHGGA